MIDSPTLRRTSSQLCATARCFAMPKQRAVDEPAVSDKRTIARPLVYILAIALTTAPTHRLRHPSRSASLARRCYSVGALDSRASRAWRSLVDNPSSSFFLLVCPAVSVARLASTVALVFSSASSLASWARLCSDLAASSVFDSAMTSLTVSCLALTAVSPLQMLLPGRQRGLCR